MTEREIEIRNRIAKDRTEYRDTVLSLKESHIVMNALWKLEVLEGDNATLREKLEKSVELPRVECVMTREWVSREIIGDIMLEWCVLYKKEGYIVAEPCLSIEAAEARLAELKGGKKE